MTSSNYLTSPLLSAPKLPCKQKSLGFSDTWELHQRYFFCPVASNHIIVRQKAAPFRCLHPGELLLQCP